MRNIPKFSIKCSDRDREFFTQRLANSSKSALSKWHQYNLRYQYGTSIPTFVSRYAAFRSCRAIIIRSVKLPQNRYRSWMRFCFIGTERDIWRGRKKISSERYVARFTIDGRHMWKLDAKWHTCKITISVIKQYYDYYILQLQHLYWIGL